METCMGRLVSRLLCLDISLFDCPATSPRPDLFFGKGGARSGGQGRPKAVAQRLALDGRERSAKLARSGRPGRVVSLLVLLNTRRYRGELAIGRASRAANLYSADP
jgi:hypothetical protein